MAATALTYASYFGLRVGGLWAIALMVGGAFLLRGASVRDFWPFGALTLSTFISIAIVLEPATFADEFKQAMLLNTTAFPQDTGTYHPHSKTLANALKAVAQANWQSGDQYENSNTELIGLLTSQASSALAPMCRPTGFQMADDWIADMRQSEMPGSAAICTRIERTFTKDCISLLRVNDNEHRDQREVQSTLEARQLCRQDLQSADTDLRSLATQPPNIDVEGRIGRLLGTVWRPGSLTEDKSWFETQLKILVPAEPNDLADVERRLSPNLQVERTIEQTRALVEQPPDDLNDVDWTLLLLEWGIKSPKPTAGQLQLMARGYTEDFNYPLRWVPYQPRLPLSADDFQQYRQGTAQSLREFASIVGRLLDQFNRPEPITDLEKYLSAPVDLTFDQADAARLLHAYTVAAQARSFHDRPNAEIARHRYLELCLVGSITFWIMAGFLAGWTTWEDERRASSASLIEDV